MLVVSGLSAIAAGAAADGVVVVAAGVGKGGVMVVLPLVVVMLSLLV